MQISTLPTEKEMATFFVANISSNYFLLEFLKNNRNNLGLSLQISTLLSLPERMLKYDIDDTNDILAGNFSYLLSARVFECLEDVEVPEERIFVDLIERMARLKLHGPLVELLTSDELETRIVGWKACLRKLGPPIQYLIFFSSLFLLANEAPSAVDRNVPGFPLGWDSQLEISFDKLDEFTQILARLFSGLIVEDSSFISYLIRKVPLDLSLVPQPLTLRYLITGFMHAAGVLPQFFASCFMIWSNLEYVLISAVPGHHAYISDLSLLSLNLLLSDIDEHLRVVKSVDKYLPESMESMFSRVTSLYVECGNDEVRTRGLLVCEIFANQLFSYNYNSKDVIPLDFGLSDSIEKRWIKYLVFDLHNTSFERSTVEVEETTELQDKAEDWDSDDSDVSLPAFDVSPDTQTKISKHAPPKLLKQCIDYLKSQKDDYDTLDRNEICLKTLPSLLRTHYMATPVDPYRRRELHDLGCPVFNRITHMMDQAGIEGFDDLRHTALVTLLVADFESIGKQLISDLWDSKGLTWSQRIEHLDILIDAAVQYLESNENNVRRVSHTNAILFGVVDQLREVKVSGEDDEDKSSMVPSKTRYIHPHTLRLAKENSRKSGIRNLWKILEVLFCDFARGLWVSRLQWLRREAHVYHKLIASDTNSDRLNEKPAEVSASTLLFLSKWVVCASTLLRLSGPNDPHIVNYCREMKHVVDWYWDWISTIRLKTILGSPDSTSTSQTLAVTSSGIPTLFNHPQVKTAILLTISTILQLSEHITKVETYTFLPFGWLDGVSTFTPDLFLGWLMNDVALIDANIRNRKMACFILDSLKRRLDKQSNSMIAKILQAYLYANDVKTLTQRAPYALSIISSSQILAIECSSNPSTVDALDARIMELLKNKDMEMKMVGVAVSQECVTQAPAYFHSSFSAWSLLMNSILQSQQISDRQLVIVLDALDGVYLRSHGRPDLMRDVVNVHLGDSAVFLIKHLESSDARLLTILPRFTSWITKFPSLMKPFVDKIEKIVLPRYFNVSIGAASCIESFLVQSCNCGGKQGCADRYAALSKSILGTIDVILDKLFVAVDENAFRQIGYAPLSLPDCGTDFVIYTPILTSWLQRIGNLLVRTFKGPLVSPVPLPISEILDILKRVFDVTNSSVPKPRSDKEMFDVCLVYISQIHSTFLEIMQELGKVAGSRLLRYRSILGNIVSSLAGIYKDNSVVRESLYKTITTLTPLLGSGFVKMIQKEVLLLACRDFTYQKPAEQTISQVEQQSISKKSRKRKSNFEAISQSDIQMKKSLAVTALDMISVCFKSSWHSIPEKKLMTINQCLAYNYMLFYTSNASPYNQKYDSEIMTKCGDVLIQIIRNGRYHQSEMIPLAVTMARMSGDDEIIDEIRNMIHPVVPAISRNIHKRIHAIEEEVDDTDMEDNDGDRVESKDAVVQTVELESKLVASTFSQTEAVKEIVPAPSPSTVSQLKQIVAKVHETVSEKNLDVVMTSPSVPQQEEKPAEEDGDISDLDDFEIVDSKPDE